MTRSMALREDMPGTAMPVCLTYCSLPYSGRGWPQTCAHILAGFPEAGMAATLVLPRMRHPLPPEITTVPALGYPMAKMPWNLVSALGASRTRSRFRELLDRADPDNTVAYFWPGAPVGLVKHAKGRGILTVREMINTFQGTAKRLLDRAYDHAGMPPSHGITDRAIDEERAELALYDYVSAPAPCVEASLAEAGIPPERILSGSFGWSPARFGHTSPHREPSTNGVRFLFVGIIGVRKGIPELLDAWGRSRVNGELVLVGPIEPALQRRVNAAADAGIVRHVAFTADLGGHYASSNVFVFPTHEEGCPQVVMEAAGCGLPVITTAMGAGRLVGHGSNGLLVEAGDVAGLAEAIRQLADDGELRQRLANRIHADAQAFTYGRIGRERAWAFADLLARRVVARPA